MTKKTRLGSSGHNTRRNGSFAGKTPSNPNPHPVGKITRLMSSGHNTRRAGSFAGKTPSGPVVGGTSEYVIKARRRGRR